MDIIYNMLSGKITKKDFADIIQLLKMAKRTGILEIKGEINGKIFFKEGSLYHCESEGYLEGEKSFFDIAVMAQGTFIFKINKTSEKHTLSDFHPILLEANKIRDKYEAVRERIPFLGSRIFLRSEKINTSKENFSKEEVIIFSNLKQNMTIKELAKAIKYSLVNTIFIVDGLLDKEYISIEDGKTAMVRTLFKTIVEKLFSHVVKIAPGLIERYVERFNQWAYSKGAYFIFKEHLEEKMPVDFDIEKRYFIYRETFHKVLSLSEQIQERQITEAYLSDVIQSLSKDFKDLFKEAKLHEVFKYYKKGSFDIEAAEEDTEKFKTELKKDLLGGIDL